MDILTPHTPNAAATMSLPLSLDSDRPRTLPVGRKIFGREEIKEMIVLGDVIVIRAGLVLKLNSWLHRHPGGEMVILHCVGMDATASIDAYHPAAALARMRPFVIGRVAEADWGVNGELWRPLCAPVQVGLWNAPPLPISDPSLDRGMLKAPEESGPVRKRTSNSNLRNDFSSGEKAATSLREAGTPGPACKPALPIAPDHSKLPLAGRLALLEPLPVPIAAAAAEGYDASPARQHALGQSFARLHATIEKDGWYTAPGPLYGYGGDIVRISMFFIAFVAASPFSAYLRALLPGGSWAAAGVEAAQMGWPRVITCAVFLGLFWHQIAFVAHDAGHFGITGDYYKDRTVGLIVANFLSGLSIGWWNDAHDVHHLVSNDIEHDPDLQHAPIFAVSTAFLDGIWSTHKQRVFSFGATARKTLGLQHHYLYLVMLFARVNLFVLSYEYLICRARADKFRQMEYTGLLFWWTWVLTLLKLFPTWPMRIAATLIALAVTCPLHIQIILSHWSQSTADLGPTETFAHRQLRTTSDVECPPWLDWVHGGLHLQVTHHLFPRLPRHNLRKVSYIVREWAEAEGIRYRSFGFTQGNREVVGALRAVAHQVRVLGMVAAASAKGEIETHA